LTGARFIALFVILLVACTFDVRTRRIPNGLIVVGYLGAIVSAYLSGLPTMVALFGGAIAGLFILLPFYLLSLIGAGDVKLFSVVGAFLGPQALVPCLLLMALSGGVLALFYLITKRSRQLPYACAILGGVGLYALLNQLHIVDNMF
jgi:prepilin peptidase CpaA